MAEYLVEYTDMEDRQIKEAEQRALGREMIHDDFLPTGNVMTFIDPIPPTAQELAAQEALRVITGEVNEANDRALIALQSYSNLTLAQKDLVLKMLLGDFVIRNQEKYF